MKHRKPITLFLVILYCLAEIQVMLFRPKALDAIHFQYKSLSACKMIFGGLKNGWTTNCSYGEICHTPSGYCLKGCQHSTQCSINEYCNVNTNQCEMGKLECDRPVPSSSSRIVVNGRESLPHSRPWQVAVDRRNKNTLDTVPVWCKGCTGTLIGERHVLTAAHCVYGPFIYVHLGKHDCSKYEMGQLSIKARHGHIHPKFREIGFIFVTSISVYDMAILTLENNVRYSTTIMPACFPKISSIAYVNHTAIASGWGLTYPGCPEPIGSQDRLREVDLTVLPIKECQNAPWVLVVERSLNVSNNVRFLNNSYALCAGKFKGQELLHNYTGVKLNYTGVQHGDSGGPLIIQDTKTGPYYVIGVAIMAPKKEKYEDSPYFIYSNVKSLLPWILDTMEGKISPNITFL